MPVDITSPSPSASAAETPAPRPASRRLDACTSRGAVAPQAIATDAQALAALPASVRAVISDRQWAMVGPDSCGASARVWRGTTELTYSFTQGSGLGAALDLPGVQSYGTLSTAARRTVRAIFDDVSGYADVHFVEAASNAAAVARLQLRTAVSADAGDARIVYSQPPTIGADGIGVITVFARQNDLATAVLRQRIGSLLGLAYPGFGIAANGLVAPTDGFADNVLSTAMSDTANACWQPSMMGPLDRAALIALYGPTAAMQSSFSISLTPRHPAVGGTAFAPGAPGLVAAHTPDSYAYVSLRDDGLFASRAGNDVALLAPGGGGSQADASGARGASIFGSAAADVLVASDFDDAIDGGGGDDVIVTGSGSDWVMVPGSGATLNITDFDLAHDWLGFADEVPESFAAAIERDAAGRQYTALRWSDTVVNLGGTTSTSVAALRARMQPRRFVAGVALCQDTPAAAQRAAYEAGRTAVGASLAPPAGPGPVAMTSSSDPAAFPVAAVAGGIGGGAALLLVAATGIGGYLRHRLRRRRALAPPPGSAAPPQRHAFAVASP